MSDPTDVFALPQTLRVLVTAGASGIGRATADLLIAAARRFISVTSPTSSSPTTAPLIPAPGPRPTSPRKRTSRGCSTM